MPACEQKSPAPGEETTRGQALCSWRQQARRARDLKCHLCVAPAIDKYVEVFGRNCPLRGVHVEAERARRTKNGCDDSPAAKPVHPTFVPASGGVMLATGPCGRSASTTVKGLDSAGWSADQPARSFPSPYALRAQAQAMILPQALRVAPTNSGHFVAAIGRHLWRPRAPGGASARQWTGSSQGGCGFSPTKGEK